MVGKLERDGAIRLALQRKKVLQNRVRTDLKAIKEIDELVRLYRKYGTDDSGVVEVSDLTSVPSSNESQYPRDRFDQMVREILQDYGRPMQSGEIASEFKKRGHPISLRNERKMAWNRLYEAKTREVIVNLPGLGYWLPNEPLTERAKAEAHDAARAVKRRPYGSGATKREWVGRPTGRPRTLTDEQLETAKRLLLTTDRSYKSIGEELGVKTTTLQRHFRGGKKALRQQSLGLVLPGMPAPPAPTNKGGKRPPKWSEEKLQRAEALSLDGWPVPRIAQELQMPVNSLYILLRERRKERSAM